MSCKCSVQPPNPSVDVTIRRPTLFGVPAMPILSAPLVVRRAQVEEAGAWAALLGHAFEPERWDAAGTERELFCGESVRTTVVVAAEGRLVATASLQVCPDVPECGWVRWVATDLDRRREGLARTLVIGSPKALPDPDGSGITWRGRG